MVSESVIVLSFQIFYKLLRRVLYRLKDSPADGAVRGNLTERTALFPGPGCLQKKRKTPNPPQITLFADLPSVSNERNLQ